jgi:putative peptidoglycan lipid II flippase
MSEVASETSENKPSVARSTALMSTATMISRVTGLVRNWAMAFALGNTFLTSAYQVANNMPNLIYEIVAGGMIGAAFLPVYLLQKEKLGKEGGDRFGTNILNIMILILGVLSVFAAIYAPQVIATQTFTVGSEADVTTYAVSFFRIFAFQILFYGIGGIFTGMLNANRIYFLPALAPAFNNIVVIAAFFAYIPLSSTSPDLAIFILGLGTTIGVAVQFLVQIPTLIKNGYRYHFFIDWHDPALIECLKIAVPTLVYIIGTMVAFTFRNAFSLQAGDNGPSTLMYAWTWFQLPYGVIAVSLSRALFTEMSESVAKDDMQGLRGLVHRGIVDTVLLIVPLATLMGALAVPIMQLFEAGAFSSDDVTYVASILALWVVALPFYSVHMFMHNVFSSLRRLIVFVAVSCGMVVVQCSLYAFLCRPEILSLAGVPIADLIYYSGCMTIMLAVLYRYIGSFNVKRILWVTLRVVCASAIGLAVEIFLSQVIPWQPGMLGGFIRLIVCGCIGLVVIFGFCRIFKIPEMSAVTSLLKRFMHRKSAS